MSIALNDRSVQKIPPKVSTLVSIVTPTLNASRYLSDCLNSVHNQRSDTVDVQHIVLDGGSSDRTLELARQFPVQFVDRPPQIGLVGAMCLGFEQANGDLVGFLGADDVLLPGALERVAERFRRDGREAIFGCTRWVDAELRSLGELAPPPTWLSAKAHASIGWCCISATSSFITPRLYRDLGGFDRRYAKNEDYEFFTRILSHEVPFSRINEAISLYRRHAENTSMQQDADYRNDYRLLLAEYAPKNRLTRRFWSIVLKSWIYTRNPTWAYHQIRHKLISRSFRG